MTKDRVVQGPKRLNHFGTRCRSVHRMIVLGSETKAIKVLCIRVSEQSVSHHKLKLKPVHCIKVGVAHVLFISKASALVCENFCLNLSYGFVY